MKIALSLAAAFLIALLSVAGANAGQGKTTVAKDRAPGTTGAAGNRCSGGSYNACVQANLKVGYNNRQAATHCTRTCAK